MGNESSTGNEEPSWMWQQMCAWIPRLSAWDTKNDQKDDQKDEQKDEQEEKKDNDQFLPVKMSAVYNSNEKELPDIATIKEFGETFYNFVSRRGDKVDQQLTLHDCYKVAGLLSKTQGKHAGLIEIKSLRNENFVWLVQMVRNYGYDSPQVKIDKKDAIYLWLRENQVLIDYRTKREFLVLKEDDSFYYTLNIPVLMAAATPHLKDGEKINPKKFKPMDKMCIDPSIKSEPHVGSDPTYWPFEWQQFNRIEELRQSNNGVFCTKNKRISMAAAERSYDSARYIQKNIGGAGSAGSGALIEYPTGGANNETGIGTIGHVLPDPAHIALPYFSADSAILDNGITKDNINLMDPITHTLKNSYHFRNIAYGDGITIVRNINHPAGLKLTYEFDINTFDDLDCGNHVIGCGYPGALHTTPKTILQNHVPSLVLFQLQALDPQSTMYGLIDAATGNIFDRNAVGIGQMGGVPGMSGFHVIASKDDTGRIIGVYWGRTIILYASYGTPRATEISLFILRNSTQLCAQFGDNANDITTSLRNRYASNVIKEGYIIDNFLLPEVQEIEKQQLSRYSLAALSVGFFGFGVLVGFALGKKK